MKQLLEILNAIIDKYQIEKADVELIQSALSELEGNAADEFNYEEE